MRNRDRALFGGGSLSEREWDHANRRQQKQVKGASNKMRFDVLFSLFFHFYLIGVHRRKQRERRFLLFGIWARLLFTSLTSVEINFASGLFVVRMFSVSCEAKFSESSEDRKISVGGSVVRIANSKRALTTVYRGKALIF